MDVPRWRGSTGEILVFDDSTLRIILTVVALVVLRQVFAKMKKNARDKSASRRVAEQAQYGGLTKRGYRFANAGRKCANRLRALSGN